MGDNPPKHIADSEENLQRRERLKGVIFLIGIEQMRAVGEGEWAFYAEIYTCRNQERKKNPCILRIANVGYARTTVSC